MTTSIISSMIQFETLYAILETLFRIKNILLLVIVFIPLSVRSLGRSK